jgi:hypothetical protein
MAKITGLTDEEKAAAGVVVEELNKLVEQANAAARERDAEAELQKPWTVAGYLQGRCDELMSSIVASANLARRDDALHEALGAATPEQLAKVKKALGV